MATFEELQNSWRTQPVTAPEDADVMQERFQKKLQQQQRSVLRSNITTTIAFSATSCFIAWVYVAFHEGHTLFFGGSIFFTICLMAVYLAVIWKGYSFKKVLDVTDEKYIPHYIRTLLWRRKTMTTYVLIYSILLWLTMMCYMYDVLAGGSLIYRIGGPLITTIYIFGVYFISRYTKVKKQIAKIDGLIHDLEQIKGSNT